MKINQVLDRVKTKGAYSKRRVTAVVDHGRQLLAASVDASRAVAAVAVKNLKATARTQQAVLTDRELPITQRLRKLRRETTQALVGARAEVTSAVKAGYRTVSDKLVRVADVTHKEQALENKLRRKAAKAQKTAERLAAAG